MGGPTGNGATEATASPPARAPALALIDGRGEVVRLTETFRAGFAPEGSLHLSIWDFLSDSDQRSQLGRVLEGRLLRAEIALPSAMGSVAAEAEAVLDAAVTRHALLTIAPTAPDSAPRSGADTLLADPSLDLSPAIVWIKDLSGRYLKINQRYIDSLGVEAASIQGKTDAELSPSQIVDGPRLLDRRGNGTEPVQLEYTAAPVEGRQALTVLRFPLHGIDGTPVALCGVAAPVADAAVARSEAERLLRIERWAGLSVAAIRAELIQEWQLAEVEPAEPAADAAPAASQPAAGRAATGAAAELQRLRTKMDATSATIAELENLLAETRASNADLESRRAGEQARSAQLEEALEAAARAPDEAVSAGRVAELEAALAEVRARAEAAEVAVERTHGLGAAGEELATERARADRAEGEVADAQARAEHAEGEVADAQARAEHAEGEVADAQARAEHAEREVADAQARAEHAEREVVAARARVRGAEGEIAAARARVAELKDARASSGAAEHNAAELEARGDLERRLAEAQRRADHAEQGLAAERAEAARARAELVARTEEAERALAAARGEAGEARAELGVRAEEAERALAAERGEAGQARGELVARAEQAERALAAERGEAGQARGELVARAEQAEQVLVAERGEMARARGELIARAERAEAAIAEVKATGERASVAAERAEAAAGLARGRADGLETALASARKTEAETRAALEQTRAEVGSLQQALARARTETAAAQEAARQAAERVERERREFADRPRAVAEAPAPAIAPSPPGPSWSHRAQRALTASIADASEWRNGLKDALRTVGTEGGWEVVVAWCPDERGNAFRCVAMWMAAPDQHALFETSTWQRRLSPAASQVGRAAAGDHANWVNDLTSADDAQLAAAAREGMSGSLLVPLRRAGETSGVLELLTGAPSGLGPEVVPAMEAVGLQLAHFEYLLRRGAEPRWRMGRL